MKTIFTNGVFDAFHAGHVKMLQYASSLGDRLIVALDTDDKVRRDKGIGRPRHKLQDRMEVVKMIKGVSEVISFSSKEELEALINMYRPDVLVVGGDWEGKEIVGSKYAKEVKFFDREGGLSSSNILNDPNLYTNEFEIQEIKNHDGCEEEAQIGFYEVKKSDDISIEDMLKYFFNIKVPHSMWAKNNILTLEKKQELEKCITIEGPVYYLCKNFKNNPYQKEISRWGCVQKNIERTEHNIEEILGKGI